MPAINETIPVVKRWGKPMHKIFIYSLLILYSCNSYTTYFNKIKGVYAVDELVYKNESYRIYMVSNVMAFKEDKQCFLPSLSYNEHEGLGTWDVVIEKNRVFVKIETEYHFFNGTYKTEFQEDKDTHMILRSDSVEIYLTKILD